MSDDSISRKRGLLWWLYQPWKWLVFIPVAVLLTLITFLALLVALPFFGPITTNRHIPPPWARLLVWLTPARIDVHGLEHARERQAFVIVANHESQFDILGLYGWLPLDFKWVLKEELRRVPLIGWGCAMLGFIFVNRQKPDQARRAVNRAVADLEAGQGVLFFPEGTRNTGQALLPFKKGAFRLAIDQQLPILPVTLKNTHRILPTKTLDLFPGRAQMHIHAPVHTDGMTLDEVPDLISRVRTIIERPLLGEHSDAA